MSGRGSYGTGVSLCLFPSSNPCPCSLRGCWAVVFPVLLVFGNALGSHRPLLSSLLLKRGVFVALAIYLVAFCSDTSDCCLLKWA